MSADPAALEARLRRLDALATELRSREIASGTMACAVRDAFRSASVDMTPAAIERRLRELSELRELCLSLQKTTGCA
jgi:hypothetical protein